MEIDSTCGRKMRKPERVPSNSFRLRCVERSLARSFEPSRRSDGLAAADAASLFARGRLIGPEGASELLHLAFGFFLGDSVSLLDLADQLIAFSTDSLQVVVGQLSPFFLDPAGDLLPFS